VNGLESRGDLLLSALSAWGTATPAQFRRACDLLLPPADESSEPGLARHTRAVARRSLIALGHVDEGEDALLVVRPPYTSVLPAPGARQAVLCGSRTQMTSAAATAAAARHGGVCRVESQVDRHPLAPSRILLTATRREDLMAIAEELGATFLPLPEAWKVLSQSSETLRAHLASLRWSEEPELNWPRRDFDAVACIFRPAGMADTGPWRLSEYLDPNSQQRRHIVWNLNRGAAIDRDWGRYLAIAKRRRTVLDYSRAARVLLVPNTSPLPIPLARTLTLCSGRIPRTINLSGEVGAPGNFRAYEQVSPDLFQEVLARTTITS
jgi:hypothetical protein